MYIFLSLPSKVSDLGEFAYRVQLCFCWGLNFLFHLQILKALKKAALGLEDEMTVVCHYLVDLKIGLRRIIMQLHQLA